MAEKWIVGKSGSADSTFVELGPYKMSTFGGSSRVQVRMLYKIYRRATTYQVWYRVQFNRTNTGYTTEAKVRTGIFIGSTRQKTHSIDVSTSNSTWKNATPSSVDEGTFSVPLGETSTASITVGFATYAAVANLDTSGKAHSSGYPSAPVKSTEPITIPRSVDYTKCATPTNLSLTDWGNNSLGFQFEIGDDGISNTINAAEIFITLDGSTPTASNYHRLERIEAQQSSGVGMNIDFDLPNSLVDSFFGADSIATAKAAVRTCGTAGASYYSDLATSSACNFTWRDKPPTPTFIKPGVVGDIIGKQNYEIQLASIDPKFYTSSSYISLDLFDITTNSSCFHEQISGNTQLITIPGSDLEIDHDYKVRLIYYYYPTNESGVWLKSQMAESAPIRVRDVQYLHPFELGVDDFNCAVPCTNVLSYRGVVRENLYLDIGSGNVCRLHWSYPGSDSSIAYYSVYIYACDNDSEAIFLPEYTTRKNEFYLTADQLDQLRGLLDEAEGFDDIMVCHASVIAHCKYGELYDVDSGDYMFAVCKASGIYQTENIVSTLNENLIKITRSIAFAKSSKGWLPVADFYTKDTNGNWQKSDITYETLVDENGQVILDINNEPILVK